MMKRIVLLVAMVTLMLALAAPAALALTCVNESRAAPKGDASGPIFKGHWVWLPSIGVEEEAWGFAPPGTIGTNGNFTNGETTSLLGTSANCDPEKTTSRQSEHGVQTGCHLPANRALRRKTGAHSGPGPSSCPIHRSAWKVR